MVGAVAAALALRRVEERHAQQRVDRLAVTRGVAHAARLPVGLEILGEDILLGLPAGIGGIVEAVLQVGVAVRGVGLHDAVVEVVDILAADGEGDAVDDEQTARARLGTHVLAHGNNQLVEEVGGGVAHEGTHGAEARLVVDVDAVVVPLVHRVLAVGLGVGLDGLVAVGVVVHRGEGLGHDVREDGVGHLRTLDLLDELLVGHLGRGERMPLAPDGDDVHRVGAVRDARLVGGAHGRPGSVPAEGQLVLALLVLAKTLVVGVVAMNLLLLFGVLHVHPLGSRLLLAAGKQATQQQRAECIFEDSFHRISS